jgi:hypothetical protein
MAEAIAGVPLGRDFRGEKLSLSWWLVWMVWLQVWWSRGRAFLSISFSPPIALLP